MTKLPRSPGSGPRMLGSLPSYVARGISGALVARVFAIAVLAAFTAGTCRSQQGPCPTAYYRLQFFSTPNIVYLAPSGATNTLQIRFSWYRTQLLPNGCPPTVNVDSDPAPQWSLTAAGQPTTLATLENCSVTCVVRAGPQEGTVLLHVSATATEPSLFQRIISSPPEAIVTIVISNSPPPPLDCTDSFGFAVPCGGLCVVSSSVTSSAISPFAATSTLPSSVLPVDPSCGPTGIGVEPVASLDPNDKVGNVGAGIRKYVSGATPLSYAIYFANQSTATAPAQQVVVTDQLDVANDELDTLNLGPISFGSNGILPPSLLASFATTIDLRPGTNLLVAVNASLDTSNGLLTWNFQSLDPSTNQPPSDPTIGFLPPGGEGSIFFTVMPKQGLAINTQIQNQAMIVFDVNPAMPTQTWVNTLDNTPPTSQVAALPATEYSNAFTLHWNGTDVGAGIQDFTIYVSDNGGPFKAFQTNTASTSATFTGQAGHAYGFYSIARDLVGNVEVPKTTAEATTQVVLDTTPPSISCGAPDGLWHATDVSIACAASDAGSGLASPSDANFVLITALPAGTEIANAATGTHSVCDVAGNCATAGPIGGNMIDKKAPRISIAAPANTSYLLKQAVNASYSCSDSGSGVATCVGKVGSGTAIETSSVGTETFSVNATDKVDNASSQSVSYSVTYALCLLYDPTRSVQSGSTLPLKLQLCDANNSDVSNSSVVVHAVSLAQLSSNSSETIQASGNANPDNDFRFDTTLGPTGGYIFNLNTKGLATGSYVLGFTAGADPVTHSLSFQVR